MPISIELWIRVEIFLELKVLQKYSWLVLGPYLSMTWIKINLSVNINSIQLKNLITLDIQDPCNQPFSFYTVSAMQLRTVFEQNVVQLC